ncbi:MAG: class I mannose-6-phosphate isomerase [Puniceicoccales bacterium]|jgi:mannose-6-phosphate isomerase|nr:class I mannose-6-phosphate isomerase [Puniceicoccales bacterium]
MRFLRFEPIYQERVWGGADFSTHLRRDLAGLPIPAGESWEIADRPEAESRVGTGKEEGSLLHELIVKKTKWLMGAHWRPKQRFPVLVKWISCQQRLSLQVHPPAELAEVFGGEYKNEVWYVAHAEPQAAIIAGLRKGVTRERFQQALAGGAVEALLHRFPVRAGDAIFTPSGRLHAIDAGCLILEIQQNADTTYRVCDWGRARRLHIAEAMRCINFDDFEPQPLSHAKGELCIADCAEFRVRAFALGAGEVLPATIPGEPAIVSVVSGALTEVDGSTISLGDNVLLPAAETFYFTSATPSRVLITDKFTGCASSGK